MSRPEGRSQGSRDQSSSALSPPPNSTPSRPLDRWEKAKILSGIAAAVLVPVAVAVVGGMASWSVRVKETNVDMMKLAVGILEAPASQDKRALRGWAADLLVRISGVSMSDEAKEELERYELPSKPEQAPEEVAAKLATHARRYLTDLLSAIGEVTKDLGKSANLPEVAVAQKTAVVPAAEYSFETGAILFGPLSLNDPEMMYHYYAKGAVDAIRPEFGRALKPGTPTWGIIYGYIDYFACSLNDSPIYGARFAQAYKGKSCERDLSQEHDYDYVFPGGEFSHVRARDFWASTLWGLHTAFCAPLPPDQQTLVARKLDSILLLSLFIAPPDVDFTKAQQALLESDRLLYQGQHAKTIEAVLRNRGLR